METEYYIIIGAVLTVILLIAIVVIVKRYKKASVIDVNDIYPLFGENNIQKIAYVRNKINVTVNNHSVVNTAGLKEAGAIGINLVGNKVKLYFDHDNELIYEALKEKKDGEKS